MEDEVAEGVHLDALAGKGFVVNEHVRPMVCVPRLTDDGRKALEVFNQTSLLPRARRRAEV